MKKKRVEMAKAMSQRMEQNPSFLDNVIMSDESYIQIEKKSLYKIYGHLAFTLQLLTLKIFQGYSSP